MNYKVIGDSCCDYTPVLKADPHFTIVPLTLEIGDYSVVDDDHFDQLDFLKRVHASPIGPKTACPSPEAYMKAMEDSDAEEVYVITLSEHLSGSYQAASQAGPQGAADQGAANSNSNPDDNVVDGDFKEV